jgi:hypothetical protein
MTIKPQYILIIFIALLTACGQVAPHVTETPTAAQVPATKALTPLATFTPPPTLLPLSTLPPSPTPTSTQPPLPIPAVLPKFPLDGYVMLFAKDSDLYFQNGENAPIKLTHIGGGRAIDTVILSDDGKKVVFFRESNYKDIYSINTDRSNEQLIVKDRPLAEYTGVYSQFIPNTHLFLFNFTIAIGSVQRGIYHVYGYKFRPREVVPQL